MCVCVNMYYMAYLGLVDRPLLNLVPLHSRNWVQLEVLSTETGLPGVRVPHCHLADALSQRALNLADHISTSGTFNVTSLTLEPQEIISK